MAHVRAQGRGLDTLDAPFDLDTSKSHAPDHEPAPESLTSRTTLV